MFLYYVNTIKAQWFGVLVFDSEPLARLGDRLAAASATISFAPVCNVVDGQTGLMPRTPSLPCEFTRSLSATLVTRRAGVQRRGARKAMPVASGVSPALAGHRLGDLTDVGFQRGARWSLAKTLVEAQHAVLAQEVCGKGILSPTGSRQVEI